MDCGGRHAQHSSGQVRLDPRHQADDRSRARYRRDAAKLVDAAATKDAAFTDVYIGKIAGETGIGAGNEIILKALEPENGWDVGHLIPPPTFALLSP